MNQFHCAGKRGRRNATLTNRVNNIPLTWEISISALAGYGRQGFH
jgi:hypothetical protein